MTEWIVKEHPDFLKDLDNLSKNDLEIFYKKKEKIKFNPMREKHLSGGSNCYREPITRNVRLVYYIKENIIWLLAIQKHEDAYGEYFKRLHSLRIKYKLSE